MRVACVLVLLTHVKKILGTRSPVRVRAACVSKFWAPGARAHPDPANGPLEIFNKIPYFDIVVIKIYIIFVREEL